MKEEMNAVQKSLEDLDSQQGQQLGFIRRRNPDVVEAWEWLQSNKDSFQDEVFGPAAICCSVKNEEYSDLVQSILAADDLLCFTAQNVQDYRKLSDQFHNNMNLSVAIRTCLAERSTFRPPVSQQEARRLGLDGFAIDFIEGPDRMLAMLCAEKRVHQAGVALSDISTAQYDQLVDGQIITNWAAGRQMYRIIRRKEYGPQASSTSTSTIQNGQYWKDQPVDSSERTELEEKLEHINREWAKSKDKNESLKTRVDERESEMQELNKRIVSRGSCCNPDMLI